MRSIQRHPTLVVDLIGTGLLAAGASMFLSMTVLRGDDLVGEIRTLKRSIAESNQTLALLKDKVDKSRAQLDKNQAILAEQGRLPEDPPVDEYFQFLSGLARTHDLSVLNQYPVGARRYPGLQESRFAYEVTGSLRDIVRFFEAIEDSPYWADIGYLKIQPPPAMPGATPNRRSAQLTLCLFSAADPAVVETEGG